MDSEADVEERDDAIEQAFCVWWEAFLADWQRRYPDMEPPQEREARESFWQVWISRNQESPVPDPKFPVRWEHAGNPEWWHS
jgi:hypothetical protein